MIHVAEVLREALAQHPDDPVAAARSVIGVEQYRMTSEFAVEAGYIWTSLSSVENGNPLFWDEHVANDLTSGLIAPPSMLSVWFRPHHWSPGRDEPDLPLRVHFDMKEALSLPEAIISSNTITFYDPIRPGDVITTYQRLVSLSEEKTTKLGTGRFWVIEVVTENDSGALCGIESYTAFGYVKGATS